MLVLEPGDIHFSNGGAVHKMNSESALGMTLVFSDGFMKKIYPYRTCSKQMSTQQKKRNFV